MRLVFAGTPQFAEAALAALLDAGHEIPLALTQPDRPSGRGMRNVESPVKRLARARGIEIYQPESLRGTSALLPIERVRADALVVAAYGHILPDAALRLAPHGAINIHASLLPRWRGAAPIQRALLAGDSRTGITIMQMDEGLDTGPIIAQQELPIREDDDAGSLTARLAALGAKMIVASLEAVAAGHAEHSPQPESGVAYAKKLDKSETKIDWARSAADIECAVRAFRPEPGARAMLRGETIKLWRATVVPGAGAPGTVLSAAAEGVVIACGEGALAVHELQRPGGKRLDAAAFLRGFPLAPGQSFDTVRADR